MEYIFSSLGVEPAYCEIFEKYSPEDDAKIHVMRCGDATVTVEFEI